MRRESYKRTLARLLMANGRRHEQIVRGLKEVEEAREEAVLEKIIAALERAVEFPELSWQPGFRAGKGAETLLLALGFKSLRADGIWTFAERLRTPAALEEYKLAIEAMKNFQVVDQKFAQLKPEPTSLCGISRILLVARGQTSIRSFDADGPFSDVLKWAKIVLNQTAFTLISTAPRRTLRSDDESLHAKTLQSLAFFPGATLELDEPRAPPPKLTTNKPKPSDLFKSIERRFDTKSNKPPPANRLAAAAAEKRAKNNKSIAANNQDKITQQIAPSPA